MPSTDVSDSPHRPSVLIGFQADLRRGLRRATRLVLGVFMPMPVRTCVFRTEECRGEDPRRAGGLPLCRGTPYALLMFLRNNSDHTVGPMNSPTHFSTSPASMEISAIRANFAVKPRLTNAN